MNKEEKKSRFCRACLLLCLCLLSASCVSGEGEYEQEIPMEVALTRTDGVAGSESTPLLLFWKETDFSTGTLGSPYKTSTPAGGIGDYADAPYNTETDYPADNSRVVVMGLCPSAMTTADSHTTYSLPSRAGLTDVLVTPNGVTGSRKQPFGRALEFAHAAVRIVLKARRTDNTVGKLYVKNLQLTVSARLVCGGVKWDTGTKQYLAAPAAADLVINHSGQILSTEDTQVAVFYLSPCSPADLLTDLTGTGGTPGLTLTADVAKDINFTTGARNANFPILDGNLNFMDQFGSPATQLKGGESYETTLKFDIDSFTLEGEEKEWEDGGKMTVPVVVPEPTPGP